MDELLLPFNPCIAAAAVAAAADGGGGSGGIQPLYHTSASGNILSTATN